MLFLSGSIHRPEVLRAKLSESNSQILQLSAILTWPDSYVTFHKCCGHWWHDSRRHPKCCLRLGRFCQTLQTLQTNQTRSRHEEINSQEGSLDSKLLSTKKISTEKSLANRKTFAEKQHCLTLTAMFWKKNCLCICLCIFIVYNSYIVYCSHVKSNWHIEL